MARSFSSLLRILFFMLLCPLTALGASLELDASVRLVHESNMQVLLSGAGRPQQEQNVMRSPIGADVSGRTPLLLPGIGRASDYFTTAAVGIGASTTAGPGIEVSFLADFERFSYRRYTGLDASTAGLRSNLVIQFTDMHSLRAGIAVDRAWYDADGLSGNRWGGNVELLQQTASKFWVAEGVEYERRSSRDSSFGSRGKAVRIRSGYRFGEVTRVMITYRNLFRTMNNGARILVDSLALAGAWELARRMEVQVAVEHQRIGVDPVATKTGNTITSLGLAYAY